MHPNLQRCRHECPHRIRTTCNETYCTCAGDNAGDLSSCCPGQCAIRRGCRRRSRLDLLGCSIGRYRRDHRRWRKLGSHLDCALGPYVAPRGNLLAGARGSCPVHHVADPALAFPRFGPYMTVNSGRWPPPPSSTEDTHGPLARFFVPEPSQRLWECPGPV